jgi:hypothetical protein
MAITLKQIPGFADVADSNFAAESFAVGLNFQRVIENAKFGITRPEFFVAKYINGDTVVLPTSVVDGYTYSREELSYVWHFALTGGTSPANNGAPTGKGAIRYMNSSVDMLTGKVLTSVEYLVADGSAPQVTSDGTLEVCTIATRRLTSLVVSPSPIYSAVSDTELSEDFAITESLMQRINRNAKFAALRAEVIYMGEFTNNTVIPNPISPADGYVYSYSEVMFHASWRWTTQADQLVDPTNPNFKQIQGLQYSISPGDGTIGVTVTYFNDGYYVSDNGRVAIHAFCQRSLYLDGGIVDFVDLNADFLSSGKPVRYDVLARQVRNTRYSILRREFFQGVYSNTNFVPLPVSPIDGYAYSRDELTYIYDWDNSDTPGPSDIRINQWSMSVNQTTGLVSITIIRVHDGGGLRTSNDGRIRVTTIAQRNHSGNQPIDLPFTGTGNGGTEVGSLVDGGFDSWYKPTDQAASAWAINQQSGTGYGAQSPGLISGFSQRLGVGASSTANPDPLTSPTVSAHYFSVISSSIDATSGQLIYFSWAQQPSVSLMGGLTVFVRFFDAIGDSVYFFVQFESVAMPGGTTQSFNWFQIPAIGDTALASNSINTAGSGSTTLYDPVTKMPTTMDFVPSSMRIEFYFNGLNGTFVDIDYAVIINQVDPSIGQVAQRGVTSLAFFPALSWTVTDTTWVPNLALTIQRVDGTTISVDSGNPTVTGLTASTTYKWYPYYSEVNKIIEHIVTGGVGTPPLLHTSPTRDLYVEWYSLKNLPLSGSPIEVVTQATPSGGGSAPPAGGSGGGDNGCVEELMVVRELHRGSILAKNVWVGDYLLYAPGTYARVESVGLYEHWEWCELVFTHGGGLTVTSGHPFMTADGLVVRAWDLTLKTLLLWTDGVCSACSIRYVKRKGYKVKITLEYPHVFYAGTDADRLTLTHNYSIEDNSTI